MQGSLSQVSCVTPPCIREHAMASLFLVFKPLGLSSFHSRNQNCCPTLAYSPMTNTSHCVLDPLVMGGMESTLGPKWWRLDMDTGIAGCDYERRLDSLLEELISWEDSKPPLCLFFYPQQDLQLHFAAFSHCYNRWKTPPWSLQCQHVKVCTWRLALLHSWVLCKPPSHPPAHVGLSPAQGSLWSPCRCLCWVGVHVHPGIQGVKPGTASEFPYLFAQAHCTQLRDLPATWVPEDDVAFMTLLNNFTLIIIP